MQGKEDAKGRNDPHFMLFVWYSAVVRVGLKCTKRNNTQEEKGNEVVIVRMRF